MDAGRKADLIAMQRQLELGGNDVDTVAAIVAEVIAAIVADG